LILYLGIIPNSDELQEIPPRAATIPVTSNTDFDKSHPLNDAPLNSTKESLNDSAQSADTLVTPCVPPDLETLDSLVSKLRAAANELESCIQKVSPPPSMATLWA
jgi:hypothetical protein